MSETVSLYGGEIHLELGEGSLRYVVKEVGKPAPGVTSILSVFDKPALVQWAANMAVDFIEANGNGAETLKLARTAHRRAAKKAADKGTEVHAFAERALVNRRVTMPTDPETKNACEAFLDWLHSKKVEPIECERVIFSRVYWYAGRFDCLARIDGELSILDFKTSSGLYTEMPLQLAGYELAHREETGEKIDHSWVVRLDKKTGKPEPHYIPLRPNLKRAWIAVKEAYDAKKVADDLVEEVKAATKRGAKTCLTQMDAETRKEINHARL